MYNVPFVIDNEQPRASVILLHGLGADGYDFAPLAKYINAAIPRLRFVLPHAPKRPIERYSGEVMRAWYDLIDARGEAQHDARGIQASCDQIENLIAEEVKVGIAEQNIALVGFSQGGVIALHTALRRPQPLAAVLALSTYLPLVSSLPEQANHKTMPILLAHGVDDNVVPFIAGKRNKVLLEAQGYVVDWHEYPIAHQVCEEEISDMTTFLARIFS